jgi:hypothetical protein
MNFPARSPDEKSSAAPARGLTLLVTNATKLTGLVLAINEAVIRTQLRPSVLAIAAFMMAGAQVSEGVLLAMIDRFLGRHDG